MEDLENKIIVKCDNGFQWIRLDTSREKNYESKAMGYCVTQDEEDDNEPIIYSLRDKDNIPHITVEFDEESNEIEQIKGRDDTSPNEKYYDDILKFYQATGATNYDEIARDQSYAILNGKVLIGGNAILSCPKGTVFDSVKIGTDSEITEWNYSVSGDFDARYSKLEYVDPDCKFGGKVYISGTNLKEWHCDVPDDFYASFSKLEYVAPKCIFGAGVYIGNTPIKEWHCDVPDDFDARYSKLEYVNPDCVFGGHVDIMQTLIKEWHCNVGGNFVASDSKLEYVAPKCKFGGSVYIRGTNLKEWHCYVPGYFDVRYSNIEIYSL